MRSVTGSASEAKRALDLGCYFSINAEMMKSTKHRALVASLPVERLLTETDGPFVEREGKPIRPSDVVDTVQEIALLRGLIGEAAAAQILNNLSTLLRL